MKQIHWGILGAGIIAKKMADAIAILEHNQVIAIASKSMDRAEKFAKAHQIQTACSYQELAVHPAIDIVYIATTHNFHFENAKLMLLHNKSVVIEKPFTVNAKEAKELVDLARTKKLFLMEAIWTRFLPSMQWLRTKIQSQDIGILRAIHISFGTFVPPKYEKRLTDPTLAGGVTLDMGIYPITLACFVTGELPKTITSAAVFSTTGVDEIANYIFQFPSECVASITTSYQLKMKNDAIFYGTKGYITVPSFPFQTGQQFSISHHNGTNDIITTEEVNIENHSNGFIYQAEAVAQCIREGHLESTIMPLEETIGIMQTMDTMREQWGFKYPFEVS